MLQYETQLAPDENARLFVGGLLYSASKADVKAFFTKFGTVANVYLAMDRERGNNRNKGFAFVQMSTAEDATRAIAGAHGKTGPGGRTIGVHLANEGQHAKGDAQLDTRWV